MHESQLLSANPAATEQLRNTEGLEAQLADARLLQRLSTELIQEDGTAGLYKKIVEAAVAIMRSQYGSMQILYPEAGSRGKLRLLASSGFTPEAEKFWEWVYQHTASSCGAALNARERVVISNLANCAFMQDTPTLPIFLNARIFAAQSTPLFSRSGTLLGMISTHWSYPHTPPENHIQLLDVLARQAADLIERTQTAEALKESEERLRALTAQLEERVKERTKELQRSNADLQQFAHVASHDLKEPVRKIRTFGLRLKQELSGQINEASKTYIEKILESASRMSTMIEGVLNYSSLSAVEQTFEPVDLNKTLTDIQNDLEILIQQKEAVIQSDKLPVVEGIGVLLYQLFYNLMNNSLKFSREGRRPVIRITCSDVIADGRECTRIAISDNGIGFSQHHSERIFDTFTRLNSKTRFDGTGLGLSLARNIVARHHGNIEASGVENNGATFTITLPRKQGTNPARHSAYPQNGAT